MECDFSQPPGRSTLPYSDLDRMLRLEKSVQDLKLLSNQQLATIRRLEAESQAKSRKLAELLTGKATVSSESNQLLRPSLQVTSHVTSARFSAGPQVARPVGQKPGLANTMKLCEAKLCQLQEERDYWKEHFQQAEQRIGKMRDKENSFQPTEMPPLQEISINKEPESLYLKKLLEENLSLKDKLFKLSKPSVNEVINSENENSSKENVPVTRPVLKSNTPVQTLGEKTCDASNRQVCPNLPNVPKVIQPGQNQLQKKVVHLTEHNKCLQHQVCRLQTELLQKANQLACCCQPPSEAPNRATGKKTTSSGSCAKTVQFSGVHQSNLPPQPYVRNCEACSKQLCRSSQNGSRPVRFEDNLDLKSVHLCEHIKCLQRQVCHLKMELEQLGKKMPGAINLRSKIKQSENEINHLASKCDSLLEQKKFHLEKISQLQKQVDILLSSAGSNPEGQVKDLIQNIEAQRDNYKTHVEKLIRDLQSKDRTSVVNELARSTGQETNSVTVQTTSTDDQPPQRRTITSDPRTKFRLPNNIPMDISDVNRERSVEVTKRTLAEREQELEETKKQVDILQKELTGCLATLQGYREKQTQTSPRNRHVDSDTEKNQWQMEKQGVSEELRKERFKTENLELQFREERKKVEQLGIYMENQRRELESQKRELEHAKKTTTQPGINLNNNHEVCQTEISGLKEKVVFLERQLERTEETLQKCQQLVADNSNKTYEVNSQLVGLRQELNQARKLGDELQLKLDRREEVLRRVNEDKDDLLTQLEETRAAHSLIQSQLSHKTESLRVVDESNNSLEQLVSKHQVTVAQLERQLRDRQVQENIIRRQLKEAEDKIKNLTIENSGLRQETSMVKENFEKMSDESQNKSDRVTDLQEELKRYVTEVKRIEEVLAMKEADRRELLQQYENLSREMSQFESVNRSLEMQAANLQIEVKSREDDLKAAKARCDDLEVYLEEILQQNEQFRLQVVALNTKVDLLTTDLKENRITRDAVLTDLDSVNDLAVKLNTEKVDLMERIGQQNERVETLQEELVKLREELLGAMGSLEEERHRARTFQEMVVGEEGGRQTVIRNRRVEQQEQEIVRQEFTRYTEENVSSNK